MDKVLNRQFVAFFNFVGWDCISLGLHFSWYCPNVEIHLPFGFIRIGWECCYEPITVEEFNNRYSRTFGIQHDIKKELEELKKAFPEYEEDKKKEDKKNNK